jgi:hypothetical protein
MHREDNSNYLLFIEPSAEDKLKVPINDELTDLMEMALSKAKEGVSNYSSLEDKKGTFRQGSGFKGRHTTDCGVRSSNIDYLLENGMITNSLATFYLRWYRYSIPNNEMLKVLKLKEYYERYKRVL